MKEVVNVNILDAVDAKVPDSNQHLPVWKALSYPTEIMQLGKKRILWHSMLNRRSGKFPTGLVPIVRGTLKNKGISVRVKPPRFKKLSLNGDISNLKVTLDSYQRDLSYKIEGHHRGIVISPTGSGKTLMQAMIIAMYGTPKTLIIVPTRDIFYQSAEVFKDLLGLHTIGLIGDGQAAIEEVTIAMYQSLVRRKDLRDINKYFNMLLVDEVHGSKALSQQIIMNQLPSIHYRYGFTGTMRLNQPDRFIIQGLLGKPIAIITDKQTGKRVTDVKLLMVKFDGKLKWSKKYHDRLVTNIWHSRSRNGLIAMIVKRVNQELGLNALILVEKLQHAEAIKERLESIGIAAPILHGRTEQKDREKLKTAIDSKELMCLIATPAVSVGTNIPNIEFILIASEIKDSVNLIQKLGRGRRKTSTKDTLLACDIFSNLGPKDRNFGKQSRLKARIYKKRGWLKGVVPFRDMVNKLRELQ